jgi:hypothetical protein
MAACQYASANCAELFACCEWNRAEEIFNFKLMMSLFACRNTGNNFPCPQEWVQFSCASRRKQNLHQTNKRTLFFPLIALPVCNHFSAHRIYPIAGVSLQNKVTFFFCNPDGSRWASGYFHHTHIYPLLKVQQLLGDPLLKALGDALNTIFSPFILKGEGALPCLSQATRLHPHRRIGRNSGTWQIACQPFLRHAHQVPGMDN